MPESLYFKKTDRRNKLDIEELEKRMVSSDEDILEIVSARMDVIGLDEIMEIIENILGNLEKEGQEELESLPSIYWIIYINKRMYEKGFLDGLLVSNESLKWFFEELKKEPHG